MRGSKVPEQDQCLSLEYLGGSTWKCHEEEFLVVFHLISTKRRNQHKVVSLTEI